MHITVLVLLCVDINVQIWQPQTVTVENHHIIQKSINPIEDIHYYLQSQLLQLVACPT